MKESILVVLDAESAPRHARPKNSKEALDVLRPRHATVGADDEASCSSVPDERLEWFFEPVEDCPVVVRRDGGEPPCAR
jgi:hypothetical protein